MFGVHFLDPLAGLVVSTMIFNAGLKTGHQRYSRYICCFFDYFSPHKSCNSLNME